MTFDPEIKSEIEKYSTAHIADIDWHISFFSFVQNDKLAKRLGEEFLSARVLYKILTGMQAEGWMKRAQIRGQVFSYASIYEAVIHHLLFDRLATEPQVIALTQFPTKKLISIPKKHEAVLQQYLSHDGKRVIPTFETIGHTDESKVRFDRKAECAVELGFIKRALCDDLVEVYEARNAIHIHAEIRKNLDYQIHLSKKAYRRMQPFKDQIVAGLHARGLDQQRAR
jgi:hypothetical protein